MLGSSCLVVDRIKDAIRLLAFFMVVDFLEDLGSVKFIGLGGKFNLCLYLIASKLVVGILKGAKFGFFGEELGLDFKECLRKDAFEPNASNLC